MPYVNIEIKAKSEHHEKVREFLVTSGAEFIGVDHQIDTYFKVSKGRLKLREGNIENHLIYYERLNNSGPKQSNVTLFPFAPGSPLKSMLAQANGVLTIVDKKREIYFIENVKFHIDTVERLGTFIEIEAIDKDGSIGKETLLEQCNRYLELLGIRKEDLVSESYSDLLLRE